MTISSERRLKTGGDPRTLADYAALREEMRKLTHPARPDINWQYTEKLCLSLFEKNGVELQTVAWYTLARTNLVGLYGMNEGLAILATLIVRQWGAIWPQPVHARIDILSALSKRLQQAMRTLTLTYADLQPLYKAESCLNSMNEVLQRLELQHASQLDALCAQMHNAAVRLENSVNQPGETITYNDINAPEVAEPIKWVYVVPSEPQLNAPVKMQNSVPAKVWKPFVAGMLSMLVVAGTAFEGWQAMNAPDAAQTRLALLPTELTNVQLQVLRQSTPSQGINMMQRQLSQLLQLQPDWALSYGERVVQQALTLWPERAKSLAEQWRQQVNAAVLPDEAQNGWHQGMMQLQELTNQLNALDEQKGKYMTVSELKSAVFAINQSFSHALPAEERLRQLSVLPEGQPPSLAQQAQTAQHLQQLLASYAVLMQKHGGHSAQNPDHEDTGG